MEKKQLKSNIVCMRVSDDELKNIQKLMEKTNLKASELMREALTLWTSRWSGICGVGAVDRKSAVKAAGA